MIILKLSESVVQKSIEYLRKGKVIIFPTDTVYGFLADVYSKKAVDKVFKIKKRPKSKPLSVFVKDLNMAKDLAEINKTQEKLLKKSWPGKYTFILKRKSGKKLYGVSKTTIALRIPKYKFLNNLLEKIHRPLVQTSVNISGKESLKKIEDIIKQFKKDPRINLIVNGDDLLKSLFARAGKPSKIIDLSKSKVKILRR